MRPYCIYEKLMEAENDIAEGAYLGCICISAKIEGKV